MRELHVDLLIIGWGKGGKTLARSAGLAGRRVAVVEQSDDMIGGSCINIACVPTKALIHDANARRSDDDPDETFAAAVERRDSLTGAMRGKNRSLLATVGTVTLVSGTARFTGPREVEVARGGDRLRITAEAVCINTGSRAALPDVPGAERGGRVFDAESIQHVSPLPSQLVIIGGGYVGLEFASMFTHFGSDVTVLVRGRYPLPREDADVAETAIGALERDGVRIIRGAGVTRIDQDARSVRITYDAGPSGGGERNEREIDADALLLSTGRRPWTDGLDLGAAGVDVDIGGWVTVDEHLRTSGDGVYALGDVHGGAQFTYTSLDDSRIVSDNLYGDGTRTLGDRLAVPTTMFLTPPLARVGLTERQARDRGLDVLVAKKRVSDIAAMPRPKIAGDARGIVKFVVDAETDLVLGAALMHVGADEVINLVAMAMRHGITATELRTAIYTHPSASEALNEVLDELKRPA